MNQQRLGNANLSMNVGTSSPLSEESKIGSHKRVASNGFVLPPIGNTQSKTI